MNLKLLSFLGVVILLLTGALIITVSSLRTQRAEKKQAIDFANNLNRDLVFYKNDHGHQVARSQALELSLRNAQSLAESERLSFVREFQGMKKSLRNLEHAIRITGQVSSDHSLALEDSIVHFDQDSTFNFQRFNYADSLNSISGVVFPDTVMLKIRATVPLRAAVFWTRKWFLGKKRYHFDVTSTNPYVTITEAEAIQIKKR